MISTNRLEKASHLAHEALLHAICNSNKPPHTFSDEFKQKIKQINTTTDKNNKQK